MTHLFLYGILHGNLKFSSIPDDHFSYIIDNCYWPVLDILSDHDVSVGIEFPSTSLQYIESIDPTFIQELKKLIAKGKVELLASGAVQCLFPLIPREINEVNLMTGLLDYQKILGTTPSTAYLNEQAFSSGLPSLYLKHGLRNLITMWEWLAKFSKTSISDYSPRIIVGSDGSRMTAIMNSYIAFQKFQRYISGEYDIDFYMKYVMSHAREGENICFPFYGSDWEIFGYKNSVLGNSQTGKEIERFRSFLEAAEKSGSISFMTPAKIAELFRPKKEILVDSPEAAIYSKKQEKFIVTRWAVCGRDNALSNTQCHLMYKNLSRLRKINIMFNLPAHFEDIEKDLVDCWASDYRTHTTDPKYAKFRLNMGQLATKLDDGISLALSKIRKSISSKFAIINYNASDWNSIPWQTKVHFAPNKYSTSLKVYVNDKEVTHQLEDVEVYRDGSIRSATLVMDPFIKARSTAILEIVNDKSPQDRKHVDRDTQQIETRSTFISFLKNRGAAIDKLVLKDIDKRPLLGWLEHGFYNDTQLSADFYSGHMIAFDRDSVKTTDLVKVSNMFASLQENPIRIPVYCSIDLPIGSLTKIYYVYTNRPRVDLEYIFNFREYRPSSFRLGIMTLNPLAYDRSKLQFSTNNGGDIERFSVAGNNIAYDESVDPRVTSHGCLGSTEGWIDIGDSKKGITIFADKSACYSVPLLNYRETKDSFFYRVYNSISELDDTTMTWWKGQKRVSFSILGRKDTPNDNIDACQKMSAGLLCVSNDPAVRFTSG